MNIKSMLMRLQNAIARDDLIEQMVLFTPKTSFSQEDKAGKVNLIVAYNSSPKSHTALDLGLLIAHQTRLATKAQVTVQVVYVLEDYESSDYANVFSSEKFFSNRQINQIEFSSASTKYGTPILTETTLQANQALKVTTSVNKFANAERILRQAVCLAEEWKSPFKAHLRFGCVANQLQKVVESEAAELLLLGCNSAKHPIVQKLGVNFPATVLGIPYVGEHCLGNDSENCGYFV